MACTDGSYVKIFDLNGSGAVEKALEVFKSDSKINQLRMLGNRLYCGL